MSPIARRWGGACWVLLRFREREFRVCPRPALFRLICMAVGCRSQPTPGVWRLRLALMRSPGSFNHTSRSRACVRVFYAWLASPVPALLTTSLRAGHMVLAIGSHQGAPLAALGIVAFAGGAWESVRGGTIDTLIRLDLALSPASEGGAQTATLRRKGCLVSNLPVALLNVVRTRFAVSPISFASPISSSNSSGGAPALPAKPSCARRVRIGKKSLRAASNGVDQKSR